MSNDTPLPYVAEASIMHLVGATSAQRGKAYARFGSASVIEWERSGNEGQRGTLTGSVQGTRSQPYTTAVELKPGPVNRSLAVTAWEPYRSSCSCPVARNCKHAAALLYTVTRQAMHERLTAERPDAHVPTPAPTPRATGTPAAQWRDLLAPLTQASTAREGSEPLAFAVELCTEYGSFGFSRFGSQPATADAIRQGASLFVGLRVMRLGSRDTWIKGGLNWKKFQYSSPLPSIRPEHASIVSRLVRLHMASSTYGVDPGEMLRLDSIGGTDAWSLLAEARDAGITFVGQGVVGSIAWADPVTAALDVRSDEQGLRLHPVAVDAEGQVRAGVRPAGEGGFFAVHIEEKPGTSARVEMIPAFHPVPTELRSLLRRSDPLVVPHDEADAFLEEYVPQLRGTVQVTSSDSSVTFPEPAPPRLQLSLTHRRGDVITLAWAWAYQYPRRTLPLQSTPRDCSARDAEHEQQVLAEVRTVWPAAAMSDETTLHEVESAWFTEHVLPQLSTLPDVDVHEHGTRPDYRELTGDPHLRITQAENPRSDRTDWFDLGFEITIGEHLVPFTAIFSALSQGKKSVLLPDKTYAKLDHPTFDRLRELLVEAESMPEWEPGAPAIGRHQVTFWEDFEDLADETETAVAWRRSVGALRDLREIPSPAVPGGLQAQLRPYQLEGFAWLAFLHQHRLGGILADDMGLGKTIQTLALILHARSQSDESGAAAAPFLVVTPSSVLSVWKSEAARFAPGLDVRVLPTTAKKRGTSVRDAADGADVIVTSYALLRLDQEEYTALGWAGLVLDEAQFVKNRTAKAHRAAAEIRAPFRLAITGTPMENSLTDLWSLLSLSAPGLFPSMPRFRDEYVKPIEQHDGSEDAQSRAQKLMARLRRRIRPFVLRRTKDLVATDLPEKQEQLVTVPLQAKHRRLYEKVLQRERQKLLGLVEDLDRNRFIVFRSLTLLRMLALDPAIVDSQHAQVPSSKLDALMENLDEVLAEGGHRVIVFSQFTSFLARVAERLDQSQVSYAYLDGATRDRAGAIASFREGELPVFLISLKAGGFGLTLTEADYVFLMDPWWNPAAEAQAVDRAHRIGQQRSVMVYRMVAESTIEEKVVALQARKAVLFSSLTEDGAAFQSMLSADDVRELLQE